MKNDFKVQKDWEKKIKSSDTSLFHSYHEIQQWLYCFLPSVTKAAKHYFQRLVALPVCQDLMGRERGCEGKIAWLFLLIGFLSLFLLEKTPRKRKSS